MEKRYGTLKVIGTVFKVLGIIMAVLTIILAIGACVLYTSMGSLFSSLASQTNPGMVPSTGGVVVGVVAGLITLIYGAVMSMAIYAFGGMIQVMTDMEENTRATAMLLHRREAPPPGGAGR